MPPLELVPESPPRPSGVIARGSSAAGFYLLPPTQIGAQSAPAPIHFHVRRNNPNSDPGSNNTTNTDARLGQLRGGDVLCWHHLKRSGDIPGVCEDKRARSGFGGGRDNRFGAESNGGVGNRRLELEGGSSGELEKGRGGEVLVTPVGMVVGGR